MSDLERAIEWNRQKAYTGDLGHSRELFCQNVVNEKFDQIQDIERQQLEEVGANKARITCKKCCTYSSCCMEYIETTIQECEAIVYYLYNHDEALTKFLNNYTVWREKVASGGDLHKEIDKIYAEFNLPQEKLTRMSRLQELDRMYYDLHIGYFDLHNPCPFLCENECIIYEVRPLSCVCSYSTSGADMCKLNDRFLPPIIRSAPPENALNSSFYHTEIETPGMFFMPLAVYEILVNSYRYLSNATGIVDLGEEANKQNLLYKPEAG